MNREHYAFLGTLMVGFWMALMMDIEPFTDEAGFWFFCTLMIGYGVVMKVRKGV